MRDANAGTLGATSFGVHQIYVYVSNEFAYCVWVYVRVVKEIDLKSIAVRLRGSNPLAPVTLLFCLF